ncbi:MAG: hypothetical protein OXI56_07840 [bacterium]|nr:hypothetical protein [bacterium]MDE0601688.1 hypothetical protein [bacterium]
MSTPPGRWSGARNAKTVEVVMVELAARMAAGRTLPARRVGAG